MPNALTAHGASTSSQPLSATARLKDMRRLQEPSTVSSGAYDYKSAQSHPDNHGSPTRCNEQFFRWIGEVLPTTGVTPLQVLDVGGGRGDLGRDTAKRIPNPAKLHWECIDIVGSASCQEFDGRAIPHPRASKDVVVFNYMMHHAADETVSLLSHARRVSRKYVVVVEDLKGTTPNETMREWDHEWHGTYRGEREWRALFRLLGFSIVRESSISSTCYTHPPPWRSTFRHPLTWPRAMFVLEVPRDAAAAFAEQQKFYPLADSLGRRLMSPAAGPDDLVTTHAEQMRLVIHSLGKLPTVVDPTRMKWTVALALAALAVPGDFVEAGVFKGGTSIAMMRVLDRAGDARPHWACDSFRGVPPPTSQDKVGGFNYVGKACGTALAAPTVRGKTTAACSRPTKAFAGRWMSSRATFEDNLHKYNVSTTRLRIVEGWYSDTLPPKGLRSIAFLRLDGDLYNSTRDSLERLEPLVAPGGYICAPR